MRIIQLPVQEISRFDSHGVDMDFLPQVPSAGSTTVNVARIIAGGVLGEHPATTLQIFAVLAGSGVVTSRGVDGHAAERWEIEPGQVAIWEPGEIHETTATADLLAVIVETSAAELVFHEHEVLFGPRYPPPMPLTAYVIGAGPAGLAAAAALKGKGVDVTVLEKSEHVGNAWRNHYDRLHLHTTRGLSKLPGLAIPREFGRWVARDDVVSYLEAYAAHHDLRIEHGVEVTRLDREGSEGGVWTVTTTEAADTPRKADAVVVATGYNHTPHVPDWPGQDGFTGQIVHASRYRNPAPYAGQEVLVVGVGNTGAEIAQDLAEHGAARVHLAIRTPPHIVPRNQGPWAAQYTGLLVRHLPTALVDALCVPVRKANFPDVAHLGLPIPDVGLATRVAQGAIPVQDIGLVAAVQSGVIRVVAPIDRLDGGEVVLADGARLAPDVVLAATGYRRALEPVVGHLGVLGERGKPIATNGRPAAPRLYFTGFTNPISGMFLEMAADARRIARNVVRSGQGRAQAVPR